ncbi:MAG TPA: hypothetical protein VE287_02965 [Actinopolymorphaceae bacterium]|nr:hypothetical protein [Actinopolymorphaceae bacterium]
MQSGAAQPPAARPPKPTPPGATPPGASPPGANPPGANPPGATPTDTTPPSGTAPQSPPKNRPDEAGSPARAPRAFQVLRILLTVLVAQILLQAITAGQLLAGTPGWRAVHAANAMLILLVALAQVIMAILIWRPGRGTPRLLGPTIGILVVIFIQASLGDSHNRTIHIPLGVLLFGGTAMLMRQLWSQGPTLARVPASKPAPSSAPASTPAPADGGTA